MKRNDEEEFYPDEGMPDLDKEFEGCYTIIRDDFSQFNLFNVTIKGDATEDGVNLCRYTVVYTDGSVKRVAWQPNDLIRTEPRHRAHGPFSVCGSAYRKPIRTGCTTKNRF